MYICKILANKQTLKFTFLIQNLPIKFMKNKLKENRIFQNPTWMYVCQVSSLWPKSLLKKEFSA